MSRRKDYPRGEPSRGGDVSDTGGWGQIFQLVLFKTPRSRTRSWLCINYESVISHVMQGMENNFVTWLSIRHTATPPDLGGSQP